MQKLTDILVVLDHPRQQHSAVRRAVQLAQVSAARLHLLSPDPAGLCPRTPGDTLCLQGGPVIQQHHTWHRSINETINHVQQMEGCQLVIKAVSPGRRLSQAFTTPHDWTLLRQCEVPVLLVKHDRPWQGATVMAAINADEQDRQHIPLNQAILSHARAIARLFAAELHLVSACPPPFARGDTRQRYLASCHGYARHHGIAPTHIHVQPGSAETLIPHLVQHYKASLLIMGTHARTGISALAIGNSAEQLLAEVDTDMLVLQPRDHMPPLEKELNR